MLTPFLLATLSFAATSSTVSGDASGFAKSLALVGDLDGDRCSEVAVGSPSDGEGRRGKVFVFSGKTGVLLRELDGDTPDGAFGSDVAGVGDQDGDGVPDLAVGSPFVRSEHAQGRVAILSGKDGHALRSLTPLPDERYFGTDITSIGDVDGDQKEDLLVRARAGAGPEEHERFVVISLATGKRLYSVESPRSVTSHDLGRPIARLFDLDGDGIPDFAVEYATDVHLCSGKDGKILKTLSAPVAATEKSLFGFSICGVPGKIPLVAVGDIHQDVHGAVHVFPVPSVADAGAAEKEGGGAELLGGEEFSGVGRSLAAAGDVDGDGNQDIAMGWSDGRLGGVQLLSGKDLSLARMIEDEPGTAQIPLGWRVAAGLDVDGDGKPDVAVSRYWPTAAASAARGVVVYSGANGRRVRELLTPAPAPEKKASGG